MVGVEVFTTAMPTLSIGDDAQLAATTVSTPTMTTRAVLTLALLRLVYRRDPTGIGPATLPHSLLETNTIPLILSGV